MKKGLLLFILLCSLPFAFAQSTSEVLEYGYGPLGINQAELNADYTNDALVRFDAPAPGGWKSTHEDIPPIAGDFDGDGLPEFPLHIGGQVDMYNFIGGSFQLAYSNLHNGSTSVNMYSASQMFYDADGDGDKEYFACGSHGGTNKIVGYDYNVSSGSPYVLWEVAVGGNLGCAVTNVAATQGIAYAPSAYTLDGSEYGVWFVKGSLTDQGMRAFVINLDTGVYNSTNQITSSACGAPNQYVLGPGGYGNGQPYQGVRGPSTKHNEKFVYSKTAVCQDPADATNKIAYIVADCVGAPLAANTRGVYAFDLRNLVGDASFGSGGWSQIGGGSQEMQLSSPSCFQKTNGERMAILSYEDGSGDIDIQEADQTGMSSLAEASFPADYDYITDMIQGEFSHPTEEGFDDVCVMAQDYETGDAYFYCVDIDDPLLADEVTAIRAGPGAGYNTIDLRAQLITHTPESDLAGDSRDEIVTNLGVFSAVPDKDTIGYSFQTDDFLPDGPSLVDGPTFLEREGLAHIDNTYDYIPGVCTSLDFNNDTFADIFCYTNTNITYFLSSTVAPNQPPLFTARELTPIDSRCLTGFDCSLEVNTTVVYNLTYADADGDDLYYSYDCDTRFSPSTTPIVVTNQSLTFNCTYDVTGIATTRIYGNDDPDYNIFKDINVTVTEVGGYLCDYDGVFEPLFGETEENCLPDFQGSQTLEELNATATAAQEEADREAFLESVGVDPNQELYSIEIVDGEIVREGTMEDMKVFLWKLFSYLVALFPYLLVGILVFGLMVFLFGGSK